MDEDTSQLEPSRLGTKTHWDSVYSRELSNFIDTGDEGEIWFGEEVVEKMVNWALDHISPISRPYILEIGAGNGTLLFALLEAGFESTRAVGIDYSADAVRLARAIAERRGLSGVLLLECNFLSQSPPKCSGQEQEWDLLLDKGTYDAIALGEKDRQGISPAVGYPARAAALLNPGGFFLITSCNFTEDELKQTFATPATGLLYHSRVSHPSIRFGGKTGSMYTTMAFQKPHLAP
ncbi:S-adenosyl-L-methionine-dependent methyltransferase [Vararia minispora EC-137]|uniref:S-adenosyl-L-methionine-dependent methyltransferase n=1 Tax=Vararia minispora EC-137 TaxID=1314806 RepID=A0ACB8QRJ6_9AGAM|nr:S-adenosyl-L-methionine-dependent methyltransferase [Vararia minispora EC-137]